MCAKFGMAIFGAEEIWHKFLTTAKRGTTFPDCGTTSIDRGVVSYGPLVGCCYFLEVCEWLRVISWWLLDACCYLNA